MCVGTNNKESGCQSGACSGDSCKTRCCSSNGCSNSCSSNNCCSSGGSQAGGCCLNGGNSSECSLHSHDHSPKYSSALIRELICHFPYAVTSVAFCLVILCFMSFFTFNYHVEPFVLKYSSSIMFHCFHFLHILFSVTGSLITFYRFSSGVFKGILVGVFSSLFFCPLSDAFMPYLAGKFLGADMEIHFCVLHELHNILPFVVLGIINGLALSRIDKQKLASYSFGSHFAHILVSAFASMFYLVSFGLSDWHTKIGMVFIFLVIAVIVPCTLSDIFTPMTFARVNRRK